MADPMRWGVRRAPNKQLVLLPGIAHGTELVYNGAPTAAPVTKQILTFLRSHAR